MIFQGQKFIYIIGEIMRFKNLLLKTLSLCLILLFIVLIIIKPDLCRQGALGGLLLCGRVIIPSLFPFTMCVLFIMKSGILRKLGFLNFFTKKLFGLDFELFSLMLLSLIGGYPVGAKLLNTAVAEKKLSPKKAGIMLNYCINAGPAFIITAVGSGIIGSQMLGNILLISHISSSVILCLISRFFGTEEENTPLKPADIKINPADNFVLSASDAASSVFSICCFVILFSSINSYITYFSREITALRFAAYLSEVTNAVTLTGNIYLISFLLGFSGISVWCQILAVGKNIKIKFPLFVLFRILHGILSSSLTYLIIKLTGIAVPTLSNGKSFSFTALYSTPALGISMLIMGIILIISLATKKYAGKILEDIV